ncbi:glucuronyl hydrolase [Raphidocelis subcapitata]|uniref:Glucuronyl hydrolase n=1 Tax=Raphidocelis subcapitata TaxID=307507 RepID=A0A2V0P7K7_9CHLO|nr:glucuronyl hydrolase [Raphidocelis subcapitata]|eukprot:GBF93075.1 glucuronyl hydrolase [Raphidocelis subcapitata]
MRRASCYHGPAAPRRRAALALALAAAFAAALLRAAPPAAAAAAAAALPPPAPAALAPGGAVCLAAAPCLLKSEGACDSLLSGGTWYNVPGLSARLSSPASDAAAAAQDAASDGDAEAEPMADLMRRVRAAAEAKALATAGRLTPQQYPMATLPDGGWETVAAGHWMSGFYPGILWQLHELGGRSDPAWPERARAWQAGLAGRQRDFGAQHDFGFIYLPSFAHSYTVTNSTEDLRQALAAAEVAANHVRPDGTTYHIVEYNPNTGAINKKYTYQGHSPDSTWARGQAWALAGFAMLASETGEAEWLDAGRQVADAYLGRMSAQGPGQAAAAASDAAASDGGGDADGGGAAGGGGAGPEGGRWDGYVPVWDFDAPWHPEMDGPRDTSGAAVAALGLLHLADACSGAAGANATAAGSGSAAAAAGGCGAKYLCAATNALRALASDKYLSPPSEAGFPALLRHATGGFPLRSHVDVGLISGDYYFLSALAKCAAMPACANA